VRAQIAGGPSSPIRVFDELTLLPSGHVGCIGRNVFNGGMILAALFALARGGSLDRLAATSFQALPLLIAGLVLQVGFRVWEPGWLPPAADIAVTVGTIALIAGFLFANRMLPGVLIAALGLVLNLVVIGLNGAMPVSPTAARIAGLDPAELDEPGLKHERMTEETVLPWLGDVIPLPRAGLVVSFGDLILAGGFAWLTYKRTRHPDHEEGARRAETADA
jgi:hypothetical protein